MAVSMLFTDLEESINTGNSKANNKMLQKNNIGLRLNNMMLDNKSIPRIKLQIDIHEQS